MGVEPARDEHPVGAELLDRRARLHVEGGAQHIAGRPGRQWEVERAAGRGRPADLVGAPRSGVEGVLVRRDVEHIGVVPEDGLRAVPVMHVPVDDQDPLPEGRARRRGDGHVVDEAEPHRPAGGGVVSRRSDGDEGDTVAAALQLVAGGQTGAGGSPRRGPRIPSRVGVGIDIPATRDAEPLQVGQVGEVMCPRQLDHGRLLEGRRHDFVLRRHRAHTGHDGGQPRRALGMAGSAVVLGHPARSGDDERRHVGSS